MKKNTKKSIIIPLFCAVYLFFMFSPFLKTTALAQNNIQKTVSIAKVTTAPLLPGDVTLDFIVDMQDAQLSLKAALGIVTLSADAIEAGDLNGNGTVDMEDAQKILNIALGI